MASSPFFKELKELIGTTEMDAPEWKKLQIVETQMTENE
jgi:hypothetical protein